MKTVKGLLGAAVIAASVASLPANALEMGATDKAIKLAINEWTGQHLSTRVAGAILERAGYSVEYVTAGYGPQFIALGEGDLHATLEIWTSNAPGQFGEAEAAGKVVDIGDLGLDAREGVLYPVHMKEICPGLPDWEALNACADKFASVETLPKGRLLDYPADWGSPGKDRFEAMGMNFTAVPAGSEGALITELEASIAKKSPLVMTFWQGVNKSATGDCDFSPTRIFKVTWAGFNDTWPAAGDILANYTLEVGAQQQMMAAVDGRGEDINAVVAAHIDANAAAVDALISAAKSR